MNGRFSRSKGQRGERELCAILSARLGVDIKRGLSASREGGADTLDLPGFAVEVKRCEKENLSAGWKQTVEQAGDRMPVLFFRASRKPWAAVVPIRFFMDQLDYPAGVEPYGPAILGLDSFCALVKAFHLPEGKPEPVSLTDYARQLAEAGIR
ncbi:MAG: hypothetical protein HZA02_08535 [Nitrospinae bacterium]|nr:hypothetical protein [Nitrospinota bacterium]